MRDALTPQPARNLPYKALWIAMLTPFNYTFIFSPNPSSASITSGRMSIPSNEYVVITNNDTAVSFSPSDQWQRWPSSAGNYMSPSYALTSAQGASVSVRFNGTCIYYYGDKNYDHGSFTVQIDDHDKITLSAYSATEVGSGVLYASPLLNPGDHELLITNVESNIVAASFFIYRPSHLPAPSECADPSTPPVALSVPLPSDEDVIIKAGDQSLVYAASNDWEDFGDYRLTYSRGASVTFTFIGTNVWYSSDMNWDHGSFDVALDGATPLTLTSFSPTTRGRQVLYGSPDLSPGKHTLHLSNHDGAGLGLVSFTYRPSRLNGSESGVESPNSVTHNGSSASGLPTPSSSQESVSAPEKHLSDAASIGIAVGIVTFVHLCILAFFVVRRMRRSRWYKPPPADIDAFPATQTSALDLEGRQGQVALDRLRPPAYTPVRKARPYDFATKPQLASESLSATRSWVSFPHQ